MSTSRDFHHRAMDFAVQGFMAQMGPDPDAAVPLFEQALELELAAIAELPELVEPTYSVLHRSAGWMAFHCRQFRRAEQLASKALAGEPPADIAAELRDLWEHSNFHRHLAQEEMDISQGEIKMSLVGGSVANGVVPLSYLLPRVANIQKLIYRIVQRMLNHPYQARVPGEIRNRYTVFAAPPRSGSFAISLRLGHPAPQSQLTGFIGPSAVIDEFIDLMAIVDSGDPEAVAERIPDRSYQQNFLGLSKGIAPDGRDIRQIRFSANTNGSTRNVTFVRPASEISPVVQTSLDTGAEFVEVSGTLRYADASSNSGHIRIKLIEDSGQSHDILVPAGLVDDIVRPMWNLPVTVYGTRRSNQTAIWLNDIWPSDQDGDQALFAPTAA